MTDIDKVLAEHRESTMPAWKGACAADGDDFPMLGIPNGLGTMNDAVLAVAEWTARGELLKKVEAERDELDTAWKDALNRLVARTRERDALRTALESFICLGHQGNPHQERCGGAWGYEEPNTWNSICVRAREALGEKS